MDMWKSETSSFALLIIRIWFNVHHMSVGSESSNGVGGGSGRGASLQAEDYWLSHDVLMFHAD